MVLRNAPTYQNEILFLQMVIEQDTDLLKEHLHDGSCSCDMEGNWSTELCEQTALNVLVMERRLAWHINMMMFLGGFSETHPGEEPAVSETEIQTLCPNEEDS